MQSLTTEETVIRFVVTPFHTRSTSNMTIHRQRRVKESLFHHFPLEDERIVGPDRTGERLERNQSHAAAGAGARSSSRTPAMTMTAL